MARMNEEELQKVQEEALGHLKEGLAIFDGIKDEAVDLVGPLLKTYMGLVLDAIDNEQLAAKQVAVTLRKVQMFQDSGFTREEAISLTVGHHG